MPANNPKRPITARISLPHLVATLDYLSEQGKIDVHDSMSDVINTAIETVARASVAPLLSNIQALQNLIGRGLIRPMSTKVEQIASMERADGVPREERQNQFVEQLDPIDEFLTQPGE